MTGLSLFVPGNFSGKAIQALREMVPTASKIANLVNPGNPFHMLTVAEELPQIARNLGVAQPVFEATTAEEIDIAFASAAAQHADAINVFGDTLTVRGGASQELNRAMLKRLPSFAGGIRAQFDFVNVASVRALRLGMRRAQEGAQETERRIPTATPPNRRTTQRSVSQRGGGRCAWVQQ